jgi:predicted PurR-regulated permease PerM
MPSKGPSKFPTGQPTSRPSIEHAVVGRGAVIGNLTTQVAIIIFSCVGAAVLCLFMLLTCYFQYRHLNKVGETVHSLVEENYCRDEVDIDDEGKNEVAHGFMFIRP